jgi:type VI secretion system secreted protein Hcp
MTSATLANTQVLRRRFRAIALSAVVVAMACALVLIGSAGTAHRAGAATARPHGLDGAVSIVMAATGVAGEGTGGSITLNSLQMGVRKAGGSAQSTGKAQFDEITITKTVDKASPSLFKNCTTGTHIKQVTLAVRKAGGVPSDVMIITLGTVLVTTVHWSFSSDTAPTETITFVFATLKVTYTPMPVIG